MDRNSGHRWRGVLIGLAVMAVGLVLLGVNVTAPGPAVLPPHVAVQRLLRRPLPPAVIVPAPPREAPDVGHAPPPPPPNETAPSADPWTVWPERAVSIAGAVTALVGAAKALAELFGYRRARQGVA